MPAPKPNIKIPSPLAMVGKRLLARGDMALRRLFNLRDHWYSRRSLAKNNFDLGMMHFAKGNFGDAIFRMKLVTTYMEPKNAQAWYVLGRAYLAEGKDELARAALKKAVALEPENEEMRYMVAVAGGKKIPTNQLPKKMPLSLSLTHFNAWATSFEKEQMTQYHYKGHILLADAVRARLMPGRVDNLVLEIGVGTGLCGSRLRDISAQITGVDFSVNMLSEAMKQQDAQGKKLYDELIAREAGEFLVAAPANAYDAVIAAGVLSYIGDVQNIFKDAARVLREDGVFGFTAERCAGAEYVFMPAEGRFGYSEPYLRMLADMVGLKLVQLSQEDIYPDYKAWLCVLKK